MVVQKVLLGVAVGSLFVGVGSLGAEDWAAKLVDAAKEGDVPAVEKSWTQLQRDLDLLQNPEKKQRAANEALLAASKEFKWEVITWLLKYANADADIVDDKGMTPLVRACMMGNLEVAKLLVDQLVRKGQKEGINRANLDGETPLHLASGRGNLPIVEYLVEHGANPQAKTILGKTPIDYAEKTGHMDLSAAENIRRVVAYLKEELKQTVQDFANSLHALESSVR
jgi:ankyrin repeat protein